jgi:hypothetical protein
MKVGDSSVCAILRFSKGIQVAARASQTNLNYFPVGLGIFGEPYLLIRTTWVEEIKSDVVEEDSPLAEGEGSYEEWKSMYIKWRKAKKGHDNASFCDSSAIP